MPWAQIAPCGKMSTQAICNTKVAPAGGNPTGQCPPRKAYFAEQYKTRDESLAQAYRGGRYTLPKWVNILA